MKKFIEPLLIKAGDKRLLLGMNRNVPKVDCRVISEDQYQLLFNAYKNFIPNEPKRVRNNEDKKKVCNYKPFIESGNCLIRTPNCLGCSHFH